MHHMMVYLLTKSVRVTIIMPGQSPLQTRQLTLVTLNLLVEVLVSYLSFLLSVPLLKGYMLLMENQTLVMTVNLIEKQTFVMTVNLAANA